MYIINKKDCTGCCACVDICGQNAITLKIDHEGFWYPEVNKNLCTDCGLCEKTCPGMYADKVNKTNKEIPLCFAAYHKEQDIRLDSTSGGVFSALANKMYDVGGYVAGAIYNEDFSVRHIVSNRGEDLVKIRGSKYLQSLCTGLYKEVKKILVKGKKVLACGSPCQMAALHLYLGKDYDNLITCDFICRGINSPKVFRKHLDSLEQQFNSKVVYVKAKNKEFGWRKLTFKAIFENGKKYYGDGEVDNFTRGYLRSGIYCRPSCYECNYKKLPRIADITLADFWGVEKIAPSLDNDTGTSLVMCNSSKGAAYFETIKNEIIYCQVCIDDVKPGNAHLLNSLPVPAINRDDFFSDIEKMPYRKVAKKYFPYKRNQIRSMLSKVKNIARKATDLFYKMGPHPKVWYQFIWINFLRKNSSCNLLKGQVIIPTTYCVFDIHPEAKLNIQGHFYVGYKKVKGSKLETRIRLEKGTILDINDDFTLYAGADIQLFKGGKLILEGGVCNINLQIVCANYIFIGKGTLIGRGVVIRDYDAHYIIKENYKVSAPIKIGNHCWICEGAMISKGVEIGDGSVVAARSLVISKTKVPPKTLVAGSPAMSINEDIEWKV
jgi:acetyltransferase-like isoleucine patch superfamily enzyme/coenzyme F420-reducing hydrogenase beta subunit